jgi:3-isopropylmalate/(R)-2-methylmalate dehydratase small subunit
MPKALQSISSRCMPLHRDNVDTDQIIPARFLKITTKLGLGQHAFSDFRTQEDGSPNLDFVMNQPQYAHARVLVAGHNFGCGSSREHAPWALVDYGFEAVIASSFADIFRNNALKNGLLVVELPEEVVSTLRHACEENPQCRVNIDIDAQTIEIEGQGAFNFPLNSFWKKCLLEGLDQVGYTLGFEDHIKQHEATAMLFPAAMPTV